MGCIVTKEFPIILNEIVSANKSITESVDSLANNFSTDSNQLIESLSELDTNTRVELISAYNKVLKSTLRKSRVKEDKLEGFQFELFRIGNKMFSFKDNDLLNTFFKPSNDSNDTAMDDLFRNEELSERREQLLITIHNNSVQANIDNTSLSTDVIESTESEGQSISDGDVTEAVSDGDNDSESSETVDDLVKSVKRKKKKGILEPSLFMEIFFNKSKGLYAKEFVPYLKMATRNVVINNVRDIDSNRPDIDMNNNANNVMEYFLDKIGLDNGIDVSTEKLQGQRKTLLELLKPKVDEIYSRTKYVARMTPAERKVYFDYIIVSELETTISNSANFFIVESERLSKIVKDKNGNSKEINYNVVNYKFNLEVINQRTNYDDAKKGDKNSAFIRGLIESTPKLVSIYSLNDNEALDITGVTDTEYRASKEEGESVFDFIRRTKLEGSEFIYDNKVKTLSYNQFNLLSVDPKFLNKNATTNDVISFLKNKADDGDNAAASLYYSFYSDKDINFYDPEAGKLKSMRSLKRIVKGLMFTSRNMNNDTVELEKILTAFTVGFKSRDQRSKMNNDGTVSSSNTADVRSVVITELKQSVSVASNPDKIDVYDKLKSSLTGKVKLTRNKEGIITINVKVNDVNYAIPLKQNTNPDPDNSSMVVYPSRVEGDWSTEYNGKYVISSSVGIGILTELGFPTTLSKSIVNVINNGVQAEQGIYTPDFTSFVVNYAMMIALNDNTRNISDSILSHLRLNPVPTKVKKRKRTDLNYDIYDYLWKFENAILNEQELIQGVDGSSQHKDGGDSRVAKVTTSQNSNINKNIQIVRDTDNIETYTGTSIIDGIVTKEINSLVSGETILVSAAYKSGKFDLNLNRIVGVKSMTEGQKMQQLVEDVFMNSVIDTYGTGREANIQTAASEETLIKINRISRGGEYNFIPLNIDGMNLSLNEETLTEQLIQSNRQNVNAIQDKVIRHYKEAFEITYGSEEMLVNDLSPKSRLLVDKFKAIFPNKVDTEIVDFANSFYDSIDAIKETDINKLQKLDVILKDNSEFLNKDILNLLDGLIGGVFFNSDARINSQLLYDIDLWNDNVFNSGIKYNDDDKLSPQKYIKSLLSKHTSYINRADIKTKFTSKSLTKFRTHLEGLGMLKTDHISEGVIHDIVYKAYHYQQMMLVPQIDPLMYSDTYTFLKGEETIDDTINNLGDHSKKINNFVMTKLANDASAQVTKFKRVKPNSSGGDSYAIGDRGLSDHEYSFVFDDYRNDKNTLGNLKNQSPEVHDGAQVILPFALYMREFALAGTKYGTKITGGLMKDINTEFNPKMGHKSIDKKGTQNTLGYASQQDTNYNIVKRLRENVPFSEDNMPVMVTVPVMSVTTMDGKVSISIDKEQPVITKKFRNIHELIQYLGDTFNPNILRDTANIMLLSENKHIKGKYPATIAFPSTRKTGSLVMNPSGNLFDHSKKVFPMKVPTESMRIILEMYKDVSVQHTGAAPTQSFSAAFAGIGSKLDGVEIFKTLGSLYEVGNIQLDIELRSTISKILSNINDYTNNDSDAELMKRAVYALSLKISKNGNTFEQLSSLYEQDGMDLIVKFVLKAYAIDIMKSELTKKSDSSTLKDILDSSGDINGALNSIFQSTIRTKLSKKGLSIELESLNQPALQEEGFKFVYKYEGKAVSKSEFMRINRGSVEDVAKAQTSEIDNANNSAKIVYAESLESYKNQFPLTIVKTIELKEGEVITNEKFEQAVNTLVEGETLLVTEPSFSIYADFAVVDSADKYSIINNKKKDNYLDKIVILDTSNNIEFRVSKLINKELLDGTIIQNC